MAAASFPLRVLILPIPKVSPEMAAGELTPVLWLAPSLQELAPAGLVSLMC
jgi:hypothetical protein